MEGNYQKAKEMEKLVVQLYEAVKCSDYKERMNILWNGSEGKKARKHTNELAHV